MENVHQHYPRFPFSISYLKENFIILSLSLLFGYTLEGNIFLYSICSLSYHIKIFSRVEDFIQGKIKVRKLCSP